MDSDQEVVNKELSLFHTGSVGDNVAWRSEMGQLALLPYHPVQKASNVVSFGTENVESDVFRNKKRQK